MDRNNQQLSKIKFESIDVDKKIIEETNNELNEIATSLRIIQEILAETGQLIEIDGANIINSSVNVEKADIYLTEGIEKLNDVKIMIDSLRNKYTVLKTIGGALTGAGIGSIAFIGGIIPGIVMASIGLTSGASIGYLSKFVV